MNQLKVFKNELFEVGAKVENGEILFDVEHVAKCLGIVSKTVKNGITYENVRWSRVNDFLPQVAEVKKGDLIPEPLVYKLAFKASNEVAEQFQDWLAIEVIPAIRKTGAYDINTSQLSPELQMFKQIFDSVALTQLKQQEQDKRLDAVEKKQESIKEVLSLHPTEWRKRVNRIINAIAQLRGGYQAYQDVRNESYQFLEERANCKLSIRLTNKKQKMALEGTSKSKIDKTNKMDVIADDTRLTEIYLSIVKEMAIKNGIEVEAS
ncbi:BRO-N domain-containing protein [Cytobacillus horneckiae]|uniref:BRO-N domain-containing protein n=1 Tax=Cytobacillus horneckiae TaxID=549687 RepID=UPI003D209D12